MADTIWFPDAIDAQRQRVRLTQTSRAALRDTPFLDERWDRSGLATRETGLAELPTDAGGAAPRFIWHTAFCCSTLLARCLDKPGINLALKEPAALMEVANVKRREGAAVSDRWLSALVAQMGQAAADEAHVTLKPTNTVNNLIADAARLFPDARHIVLTSSLKAFLVSIAKKGEAGRSFARRLFTIFAMDGHAVARMDPRQLMQMSDLQIAAIVWHMQVAAMADAVTQGPAHAFAWLDGDDFVKRPAEALGAVDEFFGLGLGAEHVGATVSGPILRRDSKDGKAAYGAGRRRKEAEQTAAALGPELDAIIEWSYGLFPTAPRDGRTARALL
ncbi:hypothetical protein [Maricaulis sp. CAU 1757]